MDNNRATGRGRRTWRYYDNMADLLEKDPSVTPPLTISALGGPKGIHIYINIYVYIYITGMTTRLKFRGVGWGFKNVGVNGKMTRDGSMTKPCLPRVAAQPQMTLSFFKPYLSPRWRYCDVMTQLDKTPQWAREDHLRHGNRDNGSDSRGYGVTIRSHWWPLVTLLYLMCW